MSSIDAMNADREARGLPPLRWNPFLEQYELDEVRGLMQLPKPTWPVEAAQKIRPIALEFNETIRDAFLQFGRAAEIASTQMRAPVVAAERTRRLATLHREASAALGRGDLKTHRRALSELRRIEPRRN